MSHDPFVQTLFNCLYALLATGSATSGIQYSEMASFIPVLKKGYGRIYFFRSSSMFGAAMQPDIKLNGEVVGESKPDGFFYVDQAAGKYIASTATETEKHSAFFWMQGKRNMSVVRCQWACF